MHGIAEVGLTFAVVGLEVAAFWYWAARYALTSWAVPGKGDAVAVVVVVAGPILLVGAGIGLLLAGMVITGISEVVLGVAVIGLVIIGHMKNNIRRRMQRR
ncbi:hypothetical protein [Streptomyces sp. CA-111067]|uniref:hypothetical protein n=1 Tax=Streptomyces sp. CA-111067 TaxID=3240046 RepID=UPI003D996F97